MNFRDFKAKYRKYPVIKSAYFALEENPPYVRRLVSEWKEKGWLIQLRRGIYLINDEDILGGVERFAISNLIYQPSYVSLESALSYYGMIPEMVAQVSSVSTRKTACFSNNLGTFTYSNIKRELFWGYSKLKVGQDTALIASPEKAILDLVYLRRGELRTAEELIESFRLDHLDLIRSSALRKASERFENAKVKKVSSELLKQLRNR